MMFNVGIFIINLLLLSTIIKGDLVGNHSYRLPNFKDIVYAMLYTAQKCSFLLNISSFCVQRYTALCYGGAFL